MALFNTKKEDEKDEKTPKTEKVVSSDVERTSFFNEEISNVLLRPRITEKATYNQQNNAYAFEVSPRANKRAIAEAFEKIYKIKPTKVNIVKTPAKKTLLKGKKGRKPGIKKAYIFLKEGDRIELV